MHTISPQGIGAVSLILKERLQFPMENRIRIAWCRVAGVRVARLATSQGLFGVPAQTLLLPTTQTSLWGTGFGGWSTGLSVCPAAPCPGTYDIV